MSHRQNQFGAQVKHRSPLYPCKTLSFSIKRCEDIYKKHPNAALSPADVCQAWGLSPSNGRLSSMLATLHYYGLTEDVGRGVDRRISLSALGKELARNRVPDAIFKKAAALKPDVFQDLWRQFRTTRSTAEKSIVAALTTGRVDRGEVPFNQDAVAKVITSFKANVAFSGLRDSDDIDLIGRDADLRLGIAESEHVSSTSAVAQSYPGGLHAAPTGDHEAEDLQDIPARRKATSGGITKIGASMGTAGEATLTWPNGADLDDLRQFLRRATYMIEAEVTSRRSS